MSNISQQKLQREPHDLNMYVHDNRDVQVLFAKGGYGITNNIDVADIVVFTGGADVNPLLYGEAALPGTGYSVPRDDQDLAQWRLCKDKMKVGICRGGQFLNVMNGGKLFQHVDGHTCSHSLTDRFTGAKHNVSSTHHQMFRPATDAVIIATASESTIKHSEKLMYKIKFDGSPLDRQYEQDYEVLYYPKSRSLCFQPHPEYVEPEGTAKYFYDVMRRILNGDFDNLPPKGEAN